MDFHSNLEYLCRVCAANTKGKNSVAECAYILKTPGLKDKLDKFLYLKIAENDALPKVLCKSCFRQVEATASLSKIAKHTQQVFRDFLLSNLPKSSSDPVNTSELISSDFLGNNDSEKLPNDPTIPLAPANSMAKLSTVPGPTAISTTTSRKDEVIVNVSVSDPLTRDNQLKMISNSQRRQSLLVEPPPRYTPKSIAQLPMAPPRSIAPKPQTIEVAMAPNLTTNNQNTAMPINYSPVKHQQMPQQQQQHQQLQAKQHQPPAQITTFTSGGYVIGRLNTGSNDKKEPKKSTTLPLAPAPDNVLQQKRKNLVKALNNIKANNSGQVSLLKSSQQKQIHPTQNATKIPLAEVVNQAAEDELPEKIIIAAPKKKSPEKSKKEPLNLSSKLAATKTVHAKPAVTTAAVVVAQEKPVSYNAPPPPAPAPAAAAKPTFPEDILLGRVIRDMDLLKLILKALQWPVSKQNMDSQILRLKNSKFTDIMSDSNLLQDTDLTQLLGPYLAPVLLAAQALQQQQHQLLQNTALNQNMSAAYITQKSPTSMDIQAQAEINKSMPYKLPPETSVQLVPATPEEQEPSTSPPLALTSSSSSFKRDRQKEPKQTTLPAKRQRRTAAQKARDSIVISDEDDEDNQPLKKPANRQRSSKSAPKVQQLQLNSNIMSQLGLLSGSGGDEANEALLALLNRQKDAISKQQNIARRRRNSISNMISLPASEFDALIDLDDDIVLMEPVTTTSSDSLNSSLGQTTQQQQQAKDQNAFVIPASRSLITRPIIKRRKTVIQTSRGIHDLIIDLNDIETNSNKEQQNVEHPKQVNPNVYNVALAPNTDTQQPNQEQSKTGAGTTSLSLLQSNVKSSTQQKKLQNKAALGQQLLEAIGLQQSPPKFNHGSSTQNETATSSTAVVVANNKQSIQQIRSALKKSLKQAQEQQRQKESSSATTSNTNNTSTIIQDADSTTKPTVKEIVVVEGKGNKSDNCSSSLVDVEDQIDKVTLMVRKNDKSQQPTSSITADKNDKNDGKKLADRRRTVPLTTATVRNARSLLLQDAKMEKTLNTAGENSVPKIVEIMQNDKSEKEDNEILNISSSSAATMPISIADSLTSVEVNQTKEEEQVPTPKRRGRKRLVDKATTTNVDKEKDDMKHTPLTEKSRTFDIAKEDETRESLRTGKSKDEDAEAAINNIKIDEETTSNKTSGRPTRQSKAQSKYYKGPDQPTQGRRSLPSRSTRNRKYS